MKSYLIITETKRFSQEGDAWKEVFGDWKRVILATEPYTVLIVAEQTFEDVRDRLRLFGEEFTLVELGKAEYVATLKA